MKICLTAEDDGAVSVCVCGSSLLLKTVIASPPVSYLRFEQPQTFSGLESDTSGTIYVPDGDWRLVLDAPQGGVRGSISAPKPGNSVRVDTILGTSSSVTLTSFGECVPVDSVGQDICGKVR